MTSPENNMLTMRIIKLLGIAGIAVLAAACMAARVQRREEEATPPAQRATSRRNVGKAKAAQAAPAPRRRAPSPRTSSCTGNEGRLRGNRRSALFFSGWAGPSRRRPRARLRAPRPDRHG